MTDHRVRDKTTVVVMTKPALPGRVKTRLTAAGGGSFTPDQAAQIHAAMLGGLLERLTQIEFAHRVVAVDGGQLNPAGALPIALPPGWRVIDQGTGNLGRRLDHVWQQFARGPIAFLGADSPDAPLAVLAALPGEAEAWIGPVADGGYWTLAAVRYLPALLAGIDWGTPTVYHQTRENARAGGIQLADLPAWHDVDEPADLDALQLRLRGTQDAALAQMARLLDQARLEDEDRPQPPMA